MTLVVFKGGGNVREEGGVVYLTERDFRGQRIAERRL